jgi:hypothetical protein
METTLLLPVVIRHGDSPQFSVDLPLLIRSCLNGLFVRCIRPDSLSHSFNTEFVLNIYVGMIHPQVEAHAASLRDPDNFWLPFASKLITWIKKPTKALAINPSSSSVQEWSWFPDGSLNTCYNCVDRHPSSWVAIQYVSPVTNTKETITYGQLRERVEAVSGMLKHELNVNKGDTVIIYSIASPENCI